MMPGLDRLDVCRQVRQTLRSVLSLTDRHGLLQPDSGEIQQKSVMHRPRAL